MKTGKIILAIVFLCGVLFAQNGIIKGKIIDAKTKHPLIGANVMLYGTDLGAASDINGFYEIKNVPEDVYKLEIKYLGYNTHIEPDIRVTRGKIFYVKDIELTESMIVGDEVTITSGYFNDSKNLPVSNYTYSKDEIVRAPGSAGDIFKAVESLPGVSTSGGEFSAFSVRGGAPTDNIILIDNIPFANISHFVEAGGNEEVQGGRFSIFTTGLIEKAVFQGGGFSSKYGGRKASFLDLSIKEGNKESFTLNGTYDLLGWEANYDGPAYLLNNTSLVISARGQDFKKVLEIMGEVGHGHPAFQDYVMKLTSDIDENNKISILGIYSTEKYIRDLYHLYKADNFDDRSMGLDKEDKLLIGLNWRHLAGKSGYLNSSIYWGKVKTNQEKGRAYPDPVNGIYPAKEEIIVRNPIGVYKSDEFQYGIKEEFLHTINKSITLNIGFQYQQIKKTSSINMNGKDTLFIFQSDEMFPGGDKFLIIDPFEINNSFGKTRTEFAGYTDLSLDITEKFNLNTGIRYEYDNLSKENYFSPRISGSYKLDPLTSVNFAAGIYYQLPEMLILASNSRNSNVKSEKATHYILGITRYLSDDIKFTAEGYYKNLENLIVKPNSNNSFAENSGKGYAYGIDLSIIKKFVNNIYGQMNYSYGVAKIKNKSSEPYFNNDFNQPHIFNILVGYQFNDSWSVSAKWKYATGRPRDEFIIYGNVLNNQNRLRYSKEITGNNNLRYNDYHSLNLRVDYRKQFSKYFALIAYIDILNLYDRENQMEDRFIETTGVNEFGSVSMIPTFGLKFEI